MKQLIRKYRPILRLSLVLSILFIPYLIGRALPLRLEGVDMPFIAQYAIGLFFAIIIVLIGFGLTKLTKWIFE